jgi:hypothetical protein
MLFLVPCALQVVAGRSEPVEDVAALTQQPLWHSLRTTSVQHTCMQPAWYIKLDTPLVQEVFL